MPYTFQRYSPYQFGQEVSRKSGLIGAASKAVNIYNGLTPLETAPFVFGALSPVVGPIAAGAVGAGLVAYGLKKIYDGFTS